MRTLSAVVTTTLLTGLSITAHAGDTKFYPGTLCQGQVGVAYTTSIFVGTTFVPIPGFYVQPAEHYTTGAAHNPSTSAEMTLVCPIVRDVVRSDGLGWTTLTVNALNTSSSRLLTCTAATFLPNDYGFGGISSNALGTDHDWADLPLSALAVPGDGYMLIWCSIPRKDSNDAPSGIASYRIDE